MVSKNIHRRAQAQRCDNFPRPIEPLVTKITLYLRFTVTGDETWMHHYVPESKLPKHPTEFQNTTIFGESNIDTFWDACRQFWSFPKRRT
jgi:hypothetical protein